MPASRLTWKSSSWSWRPSPSPACVIPRLDLCHPGVLRAILESDPVAESLSEALFPLLREKDVPGLVELARRAPGLRDETLNALRLLPNLYSGPEVLKQARRELPLLPGVAAALDALQALTDAMPDTAFSIDLADVGGYGYHSGVKFALYAEGWRDALVSGGRYDDVSRAFGRARPATGFSSIYASWRPVCRRRNRLARCARPGARPALTEAVRRLRRSGKSSFRYCPVTSRIRTNSFAIASWRCRMAPGRSERCD